MKLYDIFLAYCPVITRQLEDITKFYPYFSESYSGYNKSLSLRRNRFIVIYTIVYLLHNFD